MFKLLLLLAMLLAITACSGNHCLSVSGEYSGVQGNVEYCYSPKATEANKAPTFINDQGENYLISNDDLSEAVKKLESHTNSVKPSSMPKTTASKTVVSRFRELISR